MNVKNNEVYIKVLCKKRQPQKSIKKCNQGDQSLEGFDFSRNYQYHRIFQVSKRSKHEDNHYRQLGQLNLQDYISNNYNKMIKIKIV